MTRLVLDRKPGQRIVTDGPAVIEVSRIHGGRVKLAVEADASVRIDREETRERRQGDASCD